MWVEQGAVGQREGERRMMSFDVCETWNRRPEKWAWCYARYDVLYMPLVLLISYMAAFTLAIHNMHQLTAFNILYLSLVC